MGSDAHDALVRVIAGRLDACSEAELRELDAEFERIERRREGVRTPRRKGRR